MLHYESYLFEQLQNLSYTMIQFTNRYIHKTSVSLLTNSLSLEFTFKLILLAEVDLHKFLQKCIQPSKYLF